MPEMNELLDEAVREVEALSLRAREDRAEAADLARRVRDRKERLRAAFEHAHRARTDAGRRVAEASRELADDVREAEGLHDELQARAERAGASATELATHIGEGADRLEAALAETREEIGDEVRRLREAIAEQMEAAHAARSGIEDAARRLLDETAPQVAGSIEGAVGAVAEGRRDLLERLRAQKERAIGMCVAFMESAAAARAQLTAGLDEALSSLAERSEAAAAEVRDSLAGEALEALGRARDSVGGALDELGEAVVGATEGASGTMARIVQVAAAFHETSGRIVDKLS